MEQCNYPFYFNVVLYIEGLDNPYHCQSGLGFCANFTDAMTQIEEYFGEELYNVVHLELLDGNGSKLLLMNDDMCKDFSEHMDELSAPVPCTKNGEITPLKQREKGDI